MTYKKKSTSLFKHKTLHKSEASYMKTFIIRLVKPGRQFAFEIRLQHCSKDAVSCKHAKIGLANLVKQLF